MAARGPRGWTRSDERTLDELCERIVRAGVDASALSVEVEGGHVWLDGEVRSAWERAAVLDLAERVLGVRGVYAEIRVRDDPAANAGPAGGGPTWH